MVGDPKDFGDYYVINPKYAQTETFTRCIREDGSSHESDPYGKDQHEPGAKLDAGKNRMGLVLFGFAHAIRVVCAVGTYGAEKYTDHGWSEVPNGIERYTEAMMWYIFNEASGDTYDKDSEFLTAAHIAWNALARLELMLREE